MSTSNPIIEKLISESEARKEHHFNYVQNCEGENLSNLEEVENYCEENKNNVLCFIEPVVIQVIGINTPSIM